MQIIFIIFIFLTGVTHSKESIQIKKYEIVYIFTNQNINEVYFDHSMKKYLTNTNSTHSILNSTNTTTIYKSNLSNTPTITNTTKFKNINCKKNIWKKKNNYRYKTLKTHNLSLANTPYSFQSNNKTVTRGLWYDHFTDTYTTNTKFLQIDHIVSFKEAFCQKHSVWSQAEADEFRNSELLAELLPVYGKENSKKGSSPYYLPPNTNFQAIFVDMRKYVKSFYKLTNESF